MSFARNIGKNLSNKYSQKRLGSPKKFTIDAIKTVSKRAIQKTAEVTSYLIVNKIADKKRVFQKTITKYFEKKWEWNKNTEKKEKDNKLLMH